MTGITNGYYRIRLAAEPSPFVGIDPFGPVSPVVTRGDDEIWYISNLGDGEFTLAIGAPRSPKFFVNDEGTNVVARDRSPPTRWGIKGPDGGPYAILAPSPGPIVPYKVWTVDQPYKNKFPVTLERGLLPNRPVPENQKWYILRVPLE